MFYACNFESLTHYLDIIKRSVLTSISRIQKPPRGSNFLFGHCYFLMINTNDSCCRFTGITHTPKIYVYSSSETADYLFLQCKAATFLSKNLLGFLVGTGDWACPALWSNFKKVFSKNSERIKPFSNVNMWFLGVFSWSKMLTLSTVSFFPYTC